MAHGEFLWHDLATFDVAKARAYHAAIFGWSFTCDTIDGGTEYFYAHSREDVVAGLYEMPTMFRDEGIDSFWMSYIGVEDLHDAIGRAETAGGTTIMGPATFGHGGSIAMISDPCGAHFTLFSGQYLRPLTRQPKSGAPFWSELHTPDLDRSKAFYETLFKWQIRQEKSGSVASVHNLADAPIAKFRLVEDAAGPAQWHILFGVDDLAVTREVAKSHGGEVCAGPGEGTLACRDFNGAVMHLAEAKPRRPWFG